MTKLVRLIVVVACVVSFIQSAVAATDDARPVKFSVGAEAEWTDNRDSDPDPNEEDNLDIYLKPRVDLSFSNPGTELTGYYVLSFRDRSDPSKTQNDTLWEHDLEAKLRHAFTPRLRIRVQDKFDINDDPKVENGGNTRSDLSHIINRLTAGVSYDFLEQTSLDYTEVYRIKRYDKDEEAGVVDEDEISATLTVSHGFTEMLTALLLTKYSMYEFDDVAGLNRDFETILVAVGVDVMFNPNLLGKAQVGWQRADYDAAALGDNDQPYALIGLGGSPEQTTRINVELKHGIRDADAYPYASQDYTEGRVRAEWDPIAALTVAGEGTLRRSEYDDESGTLRSGDEDTVVAQVDVTYRFKDRFSVKLAQRYEDVDSDVDVSYTRNSTRLGCNVYF